MDRRTERERQRQREQQRLRQRQMRRRKRNNTRKLLIFGGIVVVIIMVIASMSFWFLKKYVNQYEGDHVAAGIYVEGVSVGGMSEDEVREVIDDILDDRGMASITLITTSPEESRTNVLLSELGISASNEEEIIEEMLAYGKEGNLISRYNTLRKLEESGCYYDLTYEIDSELISSFVDVTYAEMIDSPVDATLEYIDGSLTVIGGEDGEKIDVDLAVTQIEAFMSEDWDGESGEIYLSTIIVEPDVTAASLESVTSVLGTFNTYCANSGNRWNNVARGAELINGTFLMPGEELSVYEIVAPFTEENGYYNAGSYLDGEVVDSMGGGICQVSTTLYNAALYAELEIAERYAHSMLVSYVDPAMDAAIAGTYKDLKIVNNTESPIYIYGELSGTTLTFTIFGEETRDENRTLDFESVETANNGYGDPEFEENTELELGTINKVSSGYIGKTAELWKYVYVDGVLEEEIKINTSYYKSSPETYEVGTKSDSAEATALVRTAIATQDEAQINAAITSANAIIAQAAADAAAAEQAAADAAAAEQAAADAAAAQAAADAAAQAEADAAEQQSTTESEAE